MPPTNSQQLNKKRLQIFLTILALVIIVWLIAYYQTNNTTKVSESFLSNLSQNQTIPAKKEVILLRSQEADTAPLTPVERSAIFNELGGAKAQQYSLTSDEKALVLKALNGK